jgi:hypothetical protein
VRADGLPFVLGDGGQNVNGQPVCEWDVAVIIAIALALGLTNAAPERAARRSLPQQPELCVGVGKWVIEYVDK